MHICSYLIHVHPGGNSNGAVTEALNALPGCQATPADNGEDLVVLVTETADKDADLALTKQIEVIPHIDGIALVFGAEHEEEPATL